MAAGVKCISGVIRPKKVKQSHGTIQIQLKTGTAKSGGDGVFKASSKFGGSKLLSKPCCNISIREFQSSDSDLGSAQTHSHTDKIHIDHEWIRDRYPNTPQYPPYLRGRYYYSRLKVHWEAHPSSTKVVEISVLIIAKS